MTENKKFGGIESPFKVRDGYIFLYMANVHNNTVHYLNNRFYYSCVTIKAQKLRKTSRIV